VRRAENEFEIKLKKVRSDNGSEFKNTNVEEFCDEKGIKHEFSTTYTLERNGVVERKNRTLIEMARSMLDEYKVLDSFGSRLSIPLAMLQIGYIVIDSSTRHRMNFSMEGRQIFLIFWFLVANATF
jgi:transposase InsO family protein